MAAYFPDTDPDILSKIADGDEQAFTQMFHHYRNKVFHFCQKILQSDDKAKEVTQDVFMKLWITRSSLRGVAYPDAYIFTIARNICFNILKREAIKSRVTSEIAARIPFADDSTEKSIYYNEYKRLLAHAVDALPARQKEVYVLSYEQGLKRGEVAQKMQVSPETVKSQLALAIKFIRGKMGGTDQVMLLLMLLKKYIG